MNISSRFFFKEGGEYYLVISLAVEHISNWNVEYVDLLISNESLLSSYLVELGPVVHVMVRS